MFPTTFNQGNLHAEENLYVIKFWVIQISSGSSLSRMNDSLTNMSLTLILFHRIIGSRAAERLRQGIVADDRGRETRQYTGTTGKRQQAVQGKRLHERLEHVCFGYRNFGAVDAGVRS